MVLRDSNFVIKKVNWRDKVENLRELAAELNLGLDSFVLLDDSEFECAAVRAQLPMVTSVLVPRQLPDYPAVVEAITDMFLAGGITTEGRGKTAQYHQQANSQKLEAICETREAYLASLCLKIRLSRNDFEAIPRISELSCKSNQFNLTTRRYTEAELRILMRDTKATVYSLGVSDIFGDSGMTGVAVLRYAHPVATVEAFLLSCRILGRGLEFALWGALLRDAATAGMTTIEASLLPTARNGQVADLYEQLGLKLTHELDGKRFFHGELALLTPPLTPWIKISNAR
jgi:FkbH-like protein